MRMHQSPLRALEILKMLSIEYTKKHLRTLATEMNRQHIPLRDLYDVSTPQLKHLKQSFLILVQLELKITGALQKSWQRVKILEKLHRSGVVPQVWLLNVNEGLTTTVVHKVI